MSTSSTVQPTRFFSRNQLIVAVCFGLVALFIVAMRLTIPLSTGVVTDPRELFTTTGSALTGPVGGVIIGVLSGILEPNGIPLASIFAHVIGLLWIGFTYKWVYNKFSSFNIRLLCWAGIIFVYYAVFIVPGFVVGIRLFYPDIYQEVFAGVSLIDAYIASFPGAVPEMLITIVITSIAWIALPKRYRKPLW